MSPKDTTYCGYRIQSNVMSGDMWIAKDGALICYVNKEAPTIADAKAIIDRLLCDCEASGNLEKPKQHGADPHAKNCGVYTNRS